MWTHPLLKLAFLCYVFWGAWHWYIGRPVHPADGVLAPAEPEQIDLPPGPVRRQGRWALTPRAGYRITARILSVERYRFDAMADLVPEDLALGWGAMSDSRVLKEIEVMQDHRFYFWKAAPIGRETIVSHSANTHVIPVDAAVARLLARLRPGEVVTLRGTLVDARRDDGLSLFTSLTRTDQGAGACELMLVDEVVR